MMFTGKAKSNFEDYYQHFKLTKQHNLPTLEDFYELPDAMQWGVIQDWADSMGYRIDALSETVLEIGTLHGFTISKVEKKSVPYYPYTNTFYDEIDSVFGCVGYQEARNAAIEKLNEIINKIE